MPRILEEGKTPEEWVEIFAARGIHLSARTIRAEARRLGACRILGKAMLLLPEHIDQLFQEPPQRRKASQATDYHPANTTEKALEHLRQRQKIPKKPAAMSKPPKSRRYRQTPQAMVDEAEKIFDAQLREKYSRKPAKRVPEKGKLDDSGD